MIYDSDHFKAVPLISVILGLDITVLRLCIKEKITTFFIEDLINIYIYIFFYIYSQLM